jgi:hypothetical protein
MDVNVAFCRHLLKLTLEDVRKADPDVKLRDAWVYHYSGTDDWEFHFGDFYWHGSADNAYDARAKGWESWLSQKERAQ